MPSFAFDMTGPDSQIFQKMSRQSLQPHIDRRLYRVAGFVLFVCIMGAIYLAFLYRVPAAMLFTALGASALGGLILSIMALLAARGFVKAQSSQISARDKRWEIGFDEDRVTVKVGLLETRVPWAAIARVEDVRQMVIFWYRPGQGFFVPNRAFASDQTRIDFAEWAAARAQAAGANSVTS